MKEKKHKNGCNILIMAFTNLEKYVYSKKCLKQRRQPPPHSSLHQSRGYFRAEEVCTAPEMIPTPKWSPTLKWSPNRLRNDPLFSLRRPRNDPQLIRGKEWYSVTELLQVCCIVYVLESHLTFHYSLCDFSVIVFVILSPLCLLLLIQHHFKI